MPTYRNRECSITLTWVVKAPPRGKEGMVFGWWHAKARNKDNQGEGTHQNSPLQAIRSALRNFDINLVPDYVRVVERQLSNELSGEV